MTYNVFGGTLNPTLLYSAVVLLLLMVWQMKVRDVLEKYDEVIDGDRKESFQLGKW